MALLTPRPNTTTKSNHKGFYCTVTQKLHISVKVEEGSEATVHAQKTAILFYREIKTKTKKGLKL